MRNQNMLVVIILLTMPLSGMGIDIYTPSLPAVMHFFDSNSGLVKFSLTIYMLGLGIGQIFWGTLSDSWGRRYLLLTGLSGFFIVSLAIVFVHNIQIFILLRCLQGLLVAAPLSLTRSIMVDCFSGDKLHRVVSWAINAWSIGPIVAPVVGGYLQHYFNWQANFYFMATYSLLLITLMLFILPETIKHRHPLQLKEISRKSVTIFKHKLFLIIGFMFSLGYAASIAFSVVGPFLIQTTLHHSAITYGHMALLIGAGYFLGCSCNSAWSKQSIAKRCLLGCGIFLTASLSMVLLANLQTMNLLNIILPVALVFFGLGFSQPNIYAKVMSLFPKMGGLLSSSLGLYFTVLTWAFSSLAIFLKSNTQLPLAYGFFGAMLLYAILFLKFIYPKLTTKN
ncbi:MAG: MFS transporter [Gammaproteobacteria bacterium]|nr:MFS transporter [Gammaproteobacteria bacterium]